MTDASLLEAGVDALSTEVGVLDADGTVVYTNASWRRFAEENADAGGAGTESVGLNYLGVSDAADDEYAREAAAGVRAVLARERREFTLDYPCAPPGGERWFKLRATGFEHEGEWYALLTHQDITDRVRTERNAKRRNERLETVASVLSHDLRNPLAVALGFVQMVREEADDERLGRVESALDRMEDIIDAALVLARHERVEETRVVDLATFAERAWSNVQTERAALDAGETRLFRADPDLLEHVLENLFGNAVDHAGPAPSVTVGPLADGFYVEDDGPGIPEDERERVFERGFTGKGSGTGLGLEIVAQIADAHGWDVAVTEGSDGGARFEFTGVEPAG